MVKYFIDATVPMEKKAMVKQDGTALTLTGGVRVLYDDSISSGQLAVLLRCVANKINEAELE